MRILVISDVHANYEALEAVFADAGDTLRQLQATGYSLGGSHGVANDVLIALSARSIGAIVVTQNERDYRAIERVKRFRLAIVR